MLKKNIPIVFTFFLSKPQKQQLTKIRNQNIFPKGAYLYSDPIDLPEIDCERLLK
jgi:hypothetical protein